MGSFMATQKSWLQKLNNGKKPQIKRIEKSFADMKQGSLMLIPTPKMIEDYISQIPKGHKVNFTQMRQDLAFQNQAQQTCPLTAGIFLRIVAEANFEKYQKNPDSKDVVAFWRAIEPNSRLAKKLSFGSEFILERLEKEAENGA
jgi:hypothetical protein